MYYNHNIKKKGISDNYFPNYHTRQDWILNKIEMIKATIIDSNTIVSVVLLLIIRCVINLLW